MSSAFFYLEPVPLLPNPTTNKRVEAEFSIARLESESFFFSNYFKNWENNSFTTPFPLLEGHKASFGDETESKRELYKISKVAFNYLLYKEIKSDKKFETLIASIYYGIHGLSHENGSSLASTVLYQLKESGDLSKIAEILRFILETEEKLFLSDFVEFALKLSTEEIFTLYELVEYPIADFMAQLYAVSEYLKKESAVDGAVDCELSKLFIEIFTKRTMHYHKMLEPRSVFFECMGRIIRSWNVSVKVSCDPIIAELDSKIFFKQLQSIGNVNSLDFAGCQFNQQWIEELRSFLNLNMTVHSLNFSESNLTADDFNKLFEGIAHGGIQSINLSGNRGIDDRIEKTLKNLFLENPELVINFFQTGVSSYLCKFLPSHAIFSLIVQGVFKKEILYENGKLTIKRINQEGFCFLTRPFRRTYSSFMADSTYSQDSPRIRSIECDFSAIDSIEPTKLDYIQLHNFLRSLTNHPSLTIRNRNLSLSDFKETCLDGSLNKFKEINWHIYNLYDNEEICVNLEPIMFPTNLESLNFTVFTISSFDQNFFNVMIRECRIKNLTIRLPRDVGLQPHLNSDDFFNRLAHNSYLEQVDLSWNNLGTKQMLCLAEALKDNRNLKKLSLSNNEVDVEEFGRVLEKFIDVSNNTSSALKELGLSLTVNIKDAKNSQSLPKELVLAKQIIDCLRRYEHVRLEELNLTHHLFSVDHVKKIRDIEAKLQKTSPHFKIII